MGEALQQDSGSRRTVRWSLRLAVLSAVAACLAGCGSISEKMSGQMSTMPGIGMRAEAPERPAQPLAFPAVHDMPPQRTTAVLSMDEQTRLENELVTARDRQQATAGTPSAIARLKKMQANAPAPRQAAPAAPAQAPLPPVVPASSSGSIY